jgi:hypothetical protein
LEDRIKRHRRPGRKIFSFVKLTRWERIPGVKGRGQASTATIDAKSESGKPSRVLKAYRRDTDLQSRLNLLRTGLIDRCQLNVKEFRH